MMNGRSWSNSSGVSTPRTLSSAVEPCELTFHTANPAPFPPSSRYPEPPKTVVDPFDWSYRRKALTTFFCCLLAVLSGYATGSATATITQQGRLWGQSETVMLLGTTTYALAFAISPMLLAPFSEVRGRKPVFIASGSLLAISGMGCGLANSFAGFLVARFFQGAASSTFSVMVGGIVADLYRTEDRNAPMAIFAAACFFGTGSGPIISDVIVFRVSDWRWDYYVQAIAVAVPTLASIALLSETRQNVLLALRAEQLNRWTRQCYDLGMEGVQLAAAGPQPAPNCDVEKGRADDEKHVMTPSGSVSTDKVVRNVLWYVKGEEERPSLLHSIKISTTRPLRLLATEAIVFWFSLWLAFAWAVLYLALPGIPLTFDEAYGFNEEQTGGVYTAIPIAATLGAVMHIVQDKLSTKRHGQPVTEYEPESRLRFATWESLLFPIGLFWWAWTCRASVPWIVPTLGVGCAFIGCYTIFLAVLNYTADSYHRLSSSALAAQSLTRNVLGATIPLASTTMFHSLGTDGALSLLGGIALLLSAVPVLLLMYGPKIRARSKIASEIMKDGL